jgi:hypothetical protein
MPHEMSPSADASASYRMLAVGAVAPGGGPGTQAAATAWYDDIRLGAEQVWRGCIELWGLLPDAIRHAVAVALGLLTYVISHPVALMSGTVTVLAFSLVCVQFWRHARLLYVSLYIGTSFGRLCAVRDVILLALEAPISSLSFHAVQLLIEIAILRPPDKPPLRLNVKSQKEYEDKRKQWREERKEWRRQTLGHVSSLLRGAADAQVIDVDNVGDINDAREPIARYFAALVKLRHPEPAFFSEVRVWDGFVAPLFLISGLIDRFDDWKYVIAPYGRNLAPDPEKPMPDAEASFAEQRLFLFDCWLLWGPSIPVCRCHAWRGGQTAVQAVQYGYGDENRSVDLMMAQKDDETLSKQINACLLGPPETSGVRGHVLAGKATARGVIRWGAELPEEKLNPVQQGIRDRRNQRLVLDMTTGQTLSPPGGTRQNALARYYSAYFWIMFVVCDRESGLPRYGDGGKWRNLLPFFEHGNLASAVTLAALKRTLVAKVADSIVRFLEADNRLSLRYACAFDHDSADHPNLFPPPTGQSLRALLRARVEQQPKLAAFLRDGWLCIGEDGVSTEAGYAGCDLPDIVAEYYKEVDEFMASSSL